MVKRKDCNYYHDSIEEKGNGICPICGKGFSEIILEANSASVTLGGIYGRDTNPSWDNGVKILEG